MSMPLSFSTAAYSVLNSKLVHHKLQTVPQKFKLINLTFFFLQLRRLQLLLLEKGGYFSICVSEPKETAGTHQLDSSRSMGIASSIPISTIALSNLLSLLALDKVWA
jgi:hypothetical protein